MAGRRAPSARKSEKSEADLHREAAAEWRDRLEQAREEAARLEEEVERLATSLDDMGVGFLPQSRQRRQAELERAREELGDAREKVEELEDEGRKKRYPTNPPPRPADRDRR